MMTTKELIDAAHIRLLTKTEQAQLVAGLWKGTREEFKATVNKAYARAKQYDRFGGIKVHQELMALFDKLGCNDFSILYAAAKL